MLEDVEIMETLFCPVANVNERAVPLFTGTSPTVIDSPPPIGVMLSEAVAVSIKRV
jgi:hypothetical protein